MDTEPSEERVGSVHLQNVPEEILMNIFSYLLEIDLCNAAQVCTKFERVSDDQKLWRSLYRNVYQYDRPVRILRQLEFIEPNKDINHWRDSFKSMYHAVHVRPGHRAKYETHPMRYTGRRIQWCDNVGTAVESCNPHSTKGKIPLVLVHAGNHILGRSVNLDFSLQLVGAAPGTRIAKNVIVHSATKLGFYLQQFNGYLGHITLSSSGSLPFPLSWTGLSIREDSAPLVDSCIILASQPSDQPLYISGRGAKPHIIKCTIVNGRVSIEDAEPVFEDNEIL